MNDLNKPILAPQPAQDAADVLAYLRGLWQDLLRVPSVDIDDDFFALGGDSALVIEMLVAVSAHYDREFRVNKFFPEPNLRTLNALVVQELKSNHDQPCE